MRELDGVDEIAIGGAGPVEPAVMGSSA
jgi:hypothetical protein